MKSTCHSFQIFIKLQIRERFSQNSQMSNLFENPSSGSRGIPCALKEQTDRHDGANNRLSQFCERA